MQEIRTAGTLKDTLMTNSATFPQESHPPILDSPHPLHRVTLNLGLALVSWAQRSAARRHERLTTAPTRRLQADELEHRLDQLAQERAGHFVHTRLNL